MGPEKNVPNLNGAISQRLKRTEHLNYGLLPMSKQIFFGENYVEIRDKSMTLVDSKWNDSIANEM